MNRCEVTGKKPIVGRSIARRGLAKKTGGIGKKTTGITRRRFLPNLQRVKVKMPDGTVKRIWVAASAIKSGKVQKAVNHRGAYHASRKAKKA